LGQHVLTSDGKVRHGSAEYAAELQGEDVEQSLEQLRRILLPQTSVTASEIERAAAAAQHNLLDPAPE